MRRALPGVHSFCRLQVCRRVVVAVEAECLKCAFLTTVIHRCRGPAGGLIASPYLCCFAALSLLRKLLQKARERRLPRAGRRRQEHDQRPRRSLRAQISNPPPQISEERLENAFH